MNYGFKSLVNPKKDLKRNLHLENQSETAKTKDNLKTSQRENTD